jgi:5'-3' exonuclease
MGVPQFLTLVLPSVGRIVDLRYYRKGIFGPESMVYEEHQHDNDDTAHTRRDNHHHQNDTAPAPQQDLRRPMRMGIDVSTWIMRACQGFGDMLGDERHLTRSGRAALATTTTASTTTTSIGSSNSSTSATNNNDRLTQALPYITTCVQHVLHRLQDVQEASQAHLLVVLDGDTPPIKQGTVQERSRLRQAAVHARDQPVTTVDDRIRANRRGGAGEWYPHVVSHLVQALRQQKIAFLVAPYEADSQLAYLAQQGWLDVIVTEDSDLIPYGAGPLLYKLGTTSVSKRTTTRTAQQQPQDIDNIAREPCGILVRWEDLSSCAMVDLSDFTPVMLTVLYVAIGSDYCRKLKGIGVQGAVAMIRHAFLKRQCKRKRDDTAVESTTSPLEYVIQQLMQETRERKHMDDIDKADYRANFMAALLMFRHAVVFDPIRNECIHLNSRFDESRGDDAILWQDATYAALCRNATARTAITGPLVSSPLATYIAEGWIHPRTHRPYPGQVLPPSVKTYMRDYLSHLRTQQQQKKKKKKSGTPTTG